MANPFCSHRLLADSNAIPADFPAAASSALSADQPAACCSAVSALVPSVWAICAPVDPLAPSSNMARAVARLSGDTTTFDDPELDAEICFKRDSENCCSDWATALEDVPANIGPAVPLSEASCMAGPDLAAT
jgi:hypothetical protein